MELYTRNGVELAAAYKLEVHAVDDKFEIKLIFFNGENAVLPEKYDTLDIAAENAERFAAYAHEALEQAGIDMSGCSMDIVKDTRQELH